MIVCKPPIVEGVLVLACVAGLFGCRPELAAPPAGPLPVKVLQVTAADLAQQAVSPGQVEGVREVEIRARVTGILQSVHYAEGSPVKAGDLLFRIDPAPYAAALALARAQWAQEEARARQAAEESARQATLFKQQAASRKEADDAEALAVAARGARDAAAARADLARLDLEYCEVRSPIDGVAGRRLRTEGSLVNPVGPDGLLTTVVSSDRVWVRFGLPEADHARLFGGVVGGANGAEVTLTLADGSEYPLKGRVDFSSPEVDARLGNVQLRALFDNAKGRLMSGQFVRARVSGLPVKAFLVPQTSLIQTPRGRAVFVLGAGGIVEARVVGLGDARGAEVAVLSGLKAGELVVLDQLQKLRAGVKAAVAAR